MKVCIVSDSHDRADVLAQAVHAARQRGAEAVIHCGDLIGAQSLKPALEAGLPMHLIHGNNVGDTQALHRLSRTSGGQVQYHGPDARIELCGRRVFVVHYDDYGYAMACTGDWDLVCCGHSHRAEVRRVEAVRGGSSWLVNPGTVAGLAAPRTWVLGDLATMRFEVHELAAQAGVGASA
ncbi:MAG: metallophosphoesterase family protein [Gammaproteobacteria bacterium]|uniref:metallophosphoesterase family protein n=1 Tax=Azohydromonas sp. TaxID=1872666 RepID=UPI002BB21BDE|nr:metallophosphoesterase family protein [Azohydromonas sp.]HMM87208.1 metallophosphoesterase family protein [Azohydromonas sp.]